MGVRRRIQAGDIQDLRQLERRIGPAGSQGGDLRIHLAYPNNYWIAMSNLGFQAVYHLFSEDPGVVVDRAFLPENSDDPAVVSDKWRTFEKQRLIADCDVLAFSMSFETDYLHLLRILKNQNVLSPNAKVRDELAQNSDFGIPLLVAGGTAITLNPEPIADFVDVVVLGEAEELIAELVAGIRSGREQNLSRIDLLRQLAQIEGIYVPRFYKAHYKSDHTIDRFEVEPGVPTRPRRRFVKDLSNYPTFSRVLTPETEFRDMFLTETGRGCEMGCRFCVAGYIYRPVRKRSTESIAETVQIGLKNSKAIGFVGAAVSSHKEISKLASSVAAQGARASLSSLMAQKISPELAGSLSESEYKTVALAPEAGTERLRRAVGKRVSNEQFVKAAVELAQSGIRGFKLYFIVGLPTETEADVRGIPELAILIRDAVSQAAKASSSELSTTKAQANHHASQPWITLSVNPFIPKASTPFQWEAMLDRKSLDTKIALIREQIRRVPNLEMNFESPKESYFQALLSRGDRRVGEVLFHTETSGRDWKWLLQQKWPNLLPDVPALDFYAQRNISFEEILPWEIVDSLVPRDLLKREAQRARFGEDFAHRSGSAPASLDLEDTVGPGEDFDIDRAIFG